MADGADQGDAAGAGGAEHDFLVEGHEVFEAAAAAGDDEDVRPGDCAGRQAVHAGDGGGDALGGAFALDGDGPEQDRAGEAPGDGRHDVVQHGAAGRGDDADGVRQHGQGAFGGGVEQAFGGEALAQHFDAGEECAGAGVVQAVDHQLVFGAVSVGRDLAGGDDFNAVLGLQAEAREGGFPDDGADLAALVLEAEIGVAAAVELELGDFAADADAAEMAFERALDGAGEFRDGVFGDVGFWGGFVHVSGV